MTEAFIDLDLGSISTLPAAASSLKCIYCIRFFFPYLFFALPILCLLRSKDLLLTSSFCSYRATSSNGQVFTTTVAFTTTIPPGTVVTAPPLATPGSNRSNTGAIVGGVVGGLCFFFFLYPSRNPNSLNSPYLGLGGLFILAFLVFFCLRKRRKDEFDGNFDPAHVTTVNGGGGTLPKIDLGEGGLVGNSGLGVVEEDDGMGGRLGLGAGGGGIITPYSFQPAPVGGSIAVGGGQQYQNQPQMQQMSNIGADGASSSVAAAAGGEGYPNEKRAMRLHQQQSVSHHTPNTSISSGSLYPASSNANQQMSRVSPEPYSVTSDGSSSVGGGSGSGGVYYQTMGRGPSPGPSVLSSSSGGARNAKEMEAMGRVIYNPDDGRGGQQQLPAFQQAYLQTGPGPHQQQHQQYPSSSSSTTVPSQYPQSQSPTPSRPGTAVVVHDDGGRVVFRAKGEETEDGEVLNPEIPPTYDSLPVDVRRDS